MIAMKKLMMLTLLLTVTFVNGRSQTRQSKLSEEQKQELKAKIEAYKVKLNLSPEQETKVEDINMNYFEALSKLKSEDGSKLSKYKKFKQANSDKDRQMKAVLNNEQYETYKQQQKEMKQEIKSHRGK